MCVCVCVCVCVCRCLCLMRMVYACVRASINTYSGNYGYDINFFIS